MAFQSIFLKSLREYEHHSLSPKHAKFPPKKTRALTLSASHTYVGMSSAPNTSDRKTNTTSAFIAKTGASLTPEYAQNALQRFRQDEGYRSASSGERSEGLMAALGGMAEASKERQRNVTVGWEMKDKKEKGGTRVDDQNPLMYHTIGIIPGSALLSNSTATASLPANNMTSTDINWTSPKTICPNYPNDPRLNPLQRLRREWAASPREIDEYSEERTDALMAALDQMVEEGKERQKRVMEGWERNEGGKEGAMATRDGQGVIE